MSYIMNRVYVILIALCCLTNALAGPPDNFDQRVESLRNSLGGVPGVSIAIVENGQVALAKGYGVRKLRRARDSWCRTLFSALVRPAKLSQSPPSATLVDQGKIEWDDKVIDHLPDFQMYDPWVTREMTIRDLLVHRSGLGPGRRRPAFRAAKQSQPREETVKRLRYFKPATSFR